MIKSRLLCADLHFTSKEKDSYRWRIFEKLRDWCVRYKPDELDILGDLTASFDNHPAKVVNRLVDNLVQLLPFVKSIIVLKGQHDYVDEDNPFFGFVDKIDGIRFIKEPTKIRDALYIPRNKNIIPNIGKLVSQYKDNIKYCFMHETIIGSELANGQVMQEGVDPLVLDKYKKIKFWSGDIHFPQKYYVGAPYPINFGDDYKGRVLFIDDCAKERSLYMDTIKKWSLKIRKPEDLKEIKFTKRDQAKVILQLYPSEQFQYKDMCKVIRNICTVCGVDLCSLSVEIIKARKLLRRKSKVNKDIKVKSSEEILKEYGERLNLDNNFLDMGVSLL